MPSTVVGSVATGYGPARKPTEYPGPPVVCIRTHIASTAVGSVDCVAEDNQQLFHEQLAEIGTRRRYPARSFLFHHGERSDSVLLVEEGMLRLDRDTSAGRTVLVELATVGDVVGELGVIDDSPRSLTASTVSSTRVVVVEAKRFRELVASDAGASAAVLSRVTARLRALTDQFVESAAMSATSRIAARLMILASVAGHDGEQRFDLSLPITQEELGQWAGLSREGAVKGLGELRAAGAIETGRRRVRVLDADRLAAAVSGSGW